jgi:hypothetical protein
MKMTKSEHMDDPKTPLGEYVAGEKLKQDFVGPPTPEVAQGNQQCSEASTDVEITTEIVTAIARACHEVNRAYCAALGDPSQLVWEEAADWQRDSAEEGVIGVCLDPQMMPGTSHQNWAESKFASGWTWGPEKNTITKKHPCLLHFNDLPYSEQIKDVLFLTTARGLLVDAGILNSSHFG